MAKDEQKPKRQKLEASGSTPKNEDSPIEVQDQAKGPGSIVWVDCEMTGLDTVNDHIIEVCCLITDKDLNILDEEGYESVIHYDKEVLDRMNDWCIEHHGSSGLTEKVLNSSKTLPQVAEELEAYIKKYIPEKGVGILAGNTIHMDKIFLMREMPNVVEHLTYRLLDVSAFHEFCYRHNKKLLKSKPRKKKLHTAKEDILESIEEMKWFRDKYLVGPGQMLVNNNYFSKNKKAKDDSELQNTHDCVSGSLKLAKNDKQKDE